jgi:hypothetical protein
MIPNIHPSKWHSSVHAPARELHGSAPTPTGHPDAPTQEWYPGARGQNPSMPLQEGHLASSVPPRELHTVRPEESSLGMELLSSTLVSNILHNEGKWGVT